MGLFTPTKPYISQKEFRDLINDLYSSGEWTDKDRKELTMMAEPLFKIQPLPNDPPGLTKERVDDLLEEIRKPENIKIHGIQEHKIQILEGECKKFLEKNY